MKLSLIAIIVFLPALLFGQDIYHVITPETKVYSLPRTTGEQLASLKLGDELKFIKVMEDPNWTRIQSGTIVGFVQSNTIAPGKAPKTGPVKTVKYHVTVFETTLFQSGNTSSAKLGKIREKEIVDLISEDGTWAKIKSGTQVGYVYMEHLQKGIPPKEKPVKVVKTETYVVEMPQVKIYEQNNISSKVIETINKDSYLDVLQITPDGKWAKVKLEESIGYVLVAGIKKAPAGTSAGGGGGGDMNAGKARYPKKVGGMCRDGYIDYDVSATTCAQHNGVKLWIYQEPKKAKPKK